MKNKIFLTTLLLVGLVALCSNAFGQIQTNESSIKLPEGAIDFKVPINLINNSSEIFWSCPDMIPANIVANVINNGKIRLDVSTRSLNSTTKKQEFIYAGQVMPGDGLIIYGKYIQLEISCQNTATKQYGSGTL